MKHILIFLVAAFALCGAPLALADPVQNLLLSKQAEDGIHLDFTKSIENGGCCYVKAPGAPAQRNKFTNLFAFTRASTATYLGCDGLIKTAASGAPRIECDSSANVLGLLIEGARTNYVLWSEDYTNAAWTKTSTTATANTAVAPDGNTTADTVTATGADGFIAQNFQANATNVAHDFSKYLKRKTGTGAVTLEVGRTSATCTVSVSVWTRCQVLDTVLAGTYAVVSNVVTVTATGHGLLTGDAARLDYTSGTAADFSCASVTTLTADTFTCAQTTADTTGNVNVHAELGRLKFATSGDEVYAWGGQSESASFASSYIPTTTASVTRAVDNPPRAIGAEFNAAAGTMLIIGDANYSNASDSVFIGDAYQIDDGTGSNRIRIYKYQNKVGGATVTGGVTQSDTLAAGVTMTAGERFKAAAAWAANYQSGAVNGVAMAVDSSLTLPTVTTHRVGGGSLSPCYCHILRLDYWPERKPDWFLKAKTVPGPQSALKWPSYAANDNVAEYEKAA